MNYVLFGHAGSNNHGCEAIVRSTCKLIGSGKFFLQSENWNEDVKFGIDKIALPITIKENEIKRDSFLGLYFRALSRLDKSHHYDDLCCYYQNKDL